MVDEVVRFDIVAKVCNSREDRQRHGGKWVSVEVILVEGGVNKFHLALLYSPRFQIDHQPYIHQ